MTKQQRQPHPIPPRANRFVLTTTSDTLGNKRRSHIRATDGRRVIVPYAETEQAIPRPPVDRRRGMVALILIGALVVLGCIILWQQAVIPWWGGIRDQWNYGNAHISQFDANVGHGGVSHFLAEYYKGAIIVLEIPESAPNNAHIYTLTGMYGGTDSTVILLSVESGKIPGKPDLVLQAEGSTFTIILYNTGIAFQQSEG